MILMIQYPQLPIPQLSALHAGPRNVDGTRRLSHLSPLAGGGSPDLAPHLRAIAPGTVSQEATFGIQYV